MPKRKILIVDDDPGILSMLQLMLRLEGYDAIVCGDSRLVVDTMTREKPDLVLLDALMPGLDGIQVLGCRQGACFDDTGHPRYRKRERGCILKQALKGWRQGIAGETLCERGIAGPVGKVLGIEELTAALRP